MRTPLTAIVLITEITGHFEVFYPSIVVGGGQIPEGGYRMQRYGASDGDSG